MRNIGKWTVRGRSRLYGLHLKPRNLDLTLYATQEKHRKVRSWGVKFCFRKISLIIGYTLD